MKRQIAEKTALKFNGKDFAVNCDYTQERTGNYDYRDKILEHWEFTHTRVNGCGNCHSDFYYDTQESTFIFSGKGHYADERYISMYQIMSPALLLYRLIATFFGAPECSDGYKQIWHYNLKHKESGKIISFSEWKGAIGFWLPETDYKKLTPIFRNDLIELMNYIVSNECAHPYDNLVAGSVA